MKERVETGGSARKKQRQNAVKINKQAVPYYSILISIQHSFLKELAFKVMLNLKAKSNKQTKKYI